MNEEYLCPMCEEWVVDTSSCPFGSDCPGSEEQLELFNIPLSLEDEDQDRQYNPELDEVIDDVLDRVEQEDDEEWDTGQERT